MSLGLEVEKGIDPPRLYSGDDKYKNDQIFIPRASNLHIIMCKDGAEVLIPLDIVQSAFQQMHLCGKITDQFIQIVFLNRHIGR